MQHPWNTSCAGMCGLLLVDLGARSRPEILSSGMILE